MRRAHAAPHLPRPGPPPAGHALIIAGLTQSAHLDREMSAPGPEHEPDNGRPSTPTTTPIDGLSYLSSTLDWNTYPVPALTEKNRDDLTACAENVLLAREARLPATIAEIHDPEKMPDKGKPA